MNQPVRSLSGPWRWADGAGGTAGASPTCAAGWVRILSVHAVHRRAIELFTAYKALHTPRWARRGPAPRASAAVTRLRAHARSRAAPAGRPPAARAPPPRPRPAAPTPTSGTAWPQHRAPSAAALTLPRPGPPFTPRPSRRRQHGLLQVQAGEAPPPPTRRRWLPRATPRPPACLACAPPARRPRGAYARPHRAGLPRRSPTLPAPAHPLTRRAPI